MLALTRDFARLDAAPAPRSVGEPVGGRRPAAADVAGAGGQDARRSRLRADRPGAGPPRPRLRHGDVGDSPRCRRDRPETISTCSAARRSWTRCSGAPTISCSRCRSRAATRGLIGEAPAPRDEAHRRARQRLPRRYRRRGCALPGAGRGDVWPARRSTSGIVIRPRPCPTLPARQPFHELPNVLMTPHVSGWTEGMMDARARSSSPRTSPGPPGASPRRIRSTPRSSG